MGMYDESWCNGCGKSQPYTDAEEVYCGDCAEHYVTQDLLSFLKGRIETLTALREEYQAEGDFEMDDYCAGAIDAYDIVSHKLTKATA
jgi:hypothetical protein